MHLHRLVATLLVASVANSMLLNFNLFGGADKSIAKRQGGGAQQGNGSSRGSTTTRTQTGSSSNSGSSSNAETTPSSPSPSVATPNSTPNSTPRPQTPPTQSPQQPLSPTPTPVPPHTAPAGHTTPSSVSISANASEASPISTVLDGGASVSTMPPAPVVSTVFQTLTTTNSMGEAMTVTSATLTTSTPVLAGTEQNNSGSGMSAQTRNTVIGVVVGVGGAIVLVGLGLVAWRIWGRRKPEDEPNSLMEFKPTNNGYAPVEKNDGVGSSIGRSPFQSTLERYHAPSNVNTASNF